MLGNGFFIFRKMEIKFIFINDMYQISLPNEEWRSVDDIIGCYYVSNLGRIMSSRLVTTNRSKHTGMFMVRLLSLNENESGYLVVGMMHGEKRIIRKVHVLVAKAFIENTLNKRTVNHIDGNKKNNNVSNLEWLTHGENHLHAYDIGLKKYGERHYAAKIKNIDIPRIFEMRKSGMSQHRIIEIIGCSRSHIGRIINNQARVRCAKKCAHVI